MVPPAGTTLTTAIINMPTSARRRAGRAHRCPWRRWRTSALPSMPCWAQGLRRRFGQRPRGVGATIRARLPPAAAPIRRSHGGDLGRTVPNGPSTRPPPRAPRPRFRPRQRQFVFELVFEGQAHDMPIGVALGPPPPNDQQWITDEGRHYRQRHRANHLHLRRGGGAVPPWSCRAITPASRERPNTTPRSP